MLSPIHRLQELYTFIFPPNPKPPTPEECLAKANQDRHTAFRAYLEACDRGDTRDQHTTHERFVKATVEWLRLAL
jgi:hypothetical protein